MKQEYTQTPEQLLSQLETTEQGLSSAEAAARLEKYGPNKLKDAEKPTMVQRFLAQLKDPMLVILMVAAAVSAVTNYLAGESFAEVFIILIVVLLNAVLGVLQESKAEAAIEALQTMTAATCKVLRDGKQQIVHSDELVPGDVVVLEAGDSVPADGRLLESASLKIEEAALTGESVPVNKVIEALGLAHGKDEVPLGDRKNMCYMGSTVVYGRGRALVTRTGMDTEMGKIASALTSAKKELTPLQMKLNELSGILTKLVLAICVIIFAVDIVRHFGELGSNPAMMLDTFMVAVSLAVAAIPEGLVAVVTIVLSMGVTKMSRRQAIIRKMTAVETLGCTQIICSDKTGTLTQNKMTVVKHELAADEDKFLAGMALCSDAKYDAEKGEAVGEPTECALVNDAAKAGMTDLDSQRPRIGEAPFDSGRKMMSVVVKDVDGDYEQFTKGAPDVVIGLCTHVYDNGQVVELTDERREQILAANKAMADQALRVLALANRTYAEAPTDFSPEALEHDLVFCGLSGMIDPVRPEVTAAIVEAKEAGIRPVMITGDHIDTAVAIAKDLGIVEDASQAITGAELDKISDEDFKTRVTEISVYARVQPEHKARIVDAWKSLGNIVAMTGDGVNDAPSIKRADIGVGMGITGTDVTKNVADMVLADDNFATIINAVEEGRRIYDNIRKVIQFLLSANIAEVLSVFVATLIGFTIFQPVQLLWINLITDSLPALALGMEEAEGDVMKRKPRKASDGVFAGGMGIDIAFQGVIITILVLASFFAGMYFHNGAIELSMLTDGIADPEGVTMAFITLSMVEIFHSFNMRSRRASIFSMKTQNKWLWGAAALAVVLTVVPVEVDFLAEVFGFMTLDPIALFTALGLAFLIIPLMETYKAVMRRVEKNQD